MKSLTKPVLNSAAEPVSTVVEQADWFAKRFVQLKELVRSKAFQPCCPRPDRQASASDDWMRAEDELELSPLAGIEHNQQFFRITAAVPDYKAAELTVHVLPKAIVVEGLKRKGDPAKLSFFALPSPIRGDGVEASCRNGNITIVAQKEFSDDRKCQSDAQAA